MARPHPTHLPDGAEPGYFAMLGLAVFFLASLVSGMSVRAGVLACAVGYGLVMAVGVVDAMDLREPAPVIVPMMALAIVTAPAATITYRLSVWMLAVVWELDRSRQTQAQLAVAEERLRFARDLHDVLGRNLAAVAVKSELAAQLSRRGDAEAASEMMAVRQIAEDSLRDVRAVVRGYRETSLDTELAGARSVLQAAGVRCRIIGEASGLPVNVQAALGYVVREGTTNVLRHSTATTCTVSLRAADRTVTLTIENDGASPAETGDSAGSGLRGLAERLLALGGTLSGEPRADGRYVLAAWLPLAVGEVT